MNRLDQNNEDLLRRFINPEKIEKAPEGFTSKILTRIQIETQSAKESRGFFIKNGIPIISAIITFGLIVAAILIPANETASVGSLIWKYFQNLEFEIPAFDITFFQDLSLPSWISYAAIGIFMLGLFDRLLFGLFHKENK